MPPPPSPIHHQHKPFQVQCAQPNLTSAYTIYDVAATPPPHVNYSIYVDGGWESVDTDFSSEFQEQRDPTNRLSSAGIAIVPTGTDWEHQGTILFTLSDGARIGSQPAYMKLAASPARTIYEIFPDTDRHGHPCAHVWFPMNPHSHTNLVPGDTCR